MVIYYHKVKTKSITFFTNCKMNINVSLILQFGAALDCKIQVYSVFTLAFSTLYPQAQRKSYPFTDSLYTFLFT